MPFGKRHLRYTFMMLLGGGAFVIAYVFLVSYIENKVEETLVAANGKSRSFHLNLITQSLNFSELEILPSPDSPIGLQAKSLNITGLSFYTLLVDKKIVIDKVHADNGKLLINKRVDKLTQDDQSKFPADLENLSIEKISVTNMLSEIRTDTLVDFSGVLNCEATELDLQIKKGRLIYSIKTLEGKAKEITVGRNSGMYTLTLDELRYSSKEQKLVVDSMLLIPRYGKYQFAHKKGEQVGRINVSVPKLVIAGILLSDILDTAFIASKIEITSFDLHSFKDKRVPFLRTEHILLPMESLQGFAYPVTVDSIVITDSRVTIEEISEKGTESGTVVIDHINATCGVVTNRSVPEIPKYALLKASGLLMTQGEISAVFSLPLDGTPMYRAKGSLSNLTFDKLNGALENLARFRVESGHLNLMKFDFRYSDTQSIGTMEIDYEDLRIVGLKKKKDDTSDIKTLFINAIVKDNKDRSLAKGKRTGSINIERDRRRYIFNVWWKSILDGLRSSILGIEKNQGNKK